MTTKRIQVFMNGFPVDLYVEINDSAEIVSAKLKCGLELNGTSERLSEWIMNQIHWIWK